MDAIKDIIKHSFDGNAIGVEKAFDSVMTAKMNGAIEAKYDAMFGRPDVSVEPEVNLEPEEMED